MVSTCFVYFRCYLPLKNKLDVYFVNVVVAEILRTLTHDTAGGLVITKVYEFFFLYYSCRKNETPHCEQDASNQIYYLSRKKTDFMRVKKKNRGNTCVRGRPRSSAKTTRFFCLLSFRSESRDKDPEERHGLILGGTDRLVIVGAVTTNGPYSRGLYIWGLCRINSAGIAIEHI